jgi:hypothetical protein
MTSLQQTAMGGGSATAKTASYVLVAADAGGTVAMNAAGATTITVNTSLFAAGDTVFIQNLGAGATTITAGTATVSTAGSLILPQYDAGILYFTATGASIFYDYIQAGGASPLTTKGDLYGFSTVDARIPIGTNNQVLTADSAQGLGLKWATPAAGGKVLQVVSATYSTSTLVSSSSFTDTGLSLAITPTLNTSKILVLVAQQVKVNDSGSDAAGAWQLLRGATAIVTIGSSGYEAFEVTTGQQRLVFNYSYLDSPATTSSTTYKTQVRRFVSTNTVTAQDNGAPSQITLLEIGA